MIRKVERFCRMHHILHKGDPILVACSGGPDSLALLYVLAELRESYELKLTACYIHHGIRKRADEEVGFVKAAAESRGVPFCCAYTPVPELARERKQSIETTARDERYRLLEQMADECGAASIAVAHHQNDQAETVLHRFIRGTGLQGLAGMRPRNGRIIRPFLAVTRCEIEAYIETLGLTPCEDETNKDTAYLRNRIRHELLPLLLTYNPNMIDGLNRLAVIAGQEEAYMEEETARFIAEHAVYEDGAVYVLRSVLKKTHQALRRRVIRSLFADMAGSSYNVSFGYIERIEELLEKGAGKVFCGQGVRVWTTYERLYFTKLTK